VVVLQERTIADKIDRQLTHRSAARSVSGWRRCSPMRSRTRCPASAARRSCSSRQLSSDEDRALTRLICDEADRIVKLVDRMEVFSDERPIEREPVNIHSCSSM
jgi:two-component system nitrogen regulation sensor histidine kinase GlnL